MKRSEIARIREAKKRLLASIRNGPEVDPLGIGKGYLISKDDYEALEPFLKASRKEFFTIGTVTIESDANGYGAICCVDNNVYIECGEEPILFMADITRMIDWACTFGRCISSRFLYEAEGKT